MKTNIVEGLVTIVQIPTHSAEILDNRDLQSAGSPKTKEGIKVKSALTILQEFLAKKEGIKVKKPLIILQEFLERKRNNLEISETVKERGDISGTAPSTEHQQAPKTEEESNEQDTVSATHETIVAICDEMISCIEQNQQPMVSPVELEETSEARRIFIKSLLLGSMATTGVLAMAFSVMLEIAPNVIMLAGLHLPPVAVVVVFVTGLVLLAAATHAYDTNRSIRAVTPDEEKKFDLALGV